MAKLRDGQGNELIPTLLHVADRDERGRPTVCRVRYDDERIGLDANDHARNTFLLVWSPVDSQLGELDIKDLAREYETLKERADKMHELAVIVRQDIETVKAENARLVAENEQKTVALRELNKERDPERFDKAVADKVDFMTGLLQAKLKVSNEIIAKQESELRELRATKKKLREAIERYKEGRK